MIQFEYAITDPNGLHARPAGLLVKKAQEYENDLTVECNGRSANLKKLLAVMGLGIRCGDTMTVRVGGKDAEACATELRSFLRANL